ncbi:putative transporter -like protein [Hapsidospora chrysogenum ATCC 11550]|uniref:Putative transporter-like protein n=1 Tax=Hapsidospora chrysogenum (strain ATCC 11550 / CBS 779.69 / DSM 880 / IAM 14645 / JCM 23072 / IMI 49137) TaxID=857340 RepID=A0A086T2S8_HAPC1|nr:putative transporter -like protein [Hapsidospora chrysogenum ATCC 11550]
MAPGVPQILEEFGSSMSSTAGYQSTTSATLYSSSFRPAVLFQTNIPMLMAFRFLSGVAGVAVITCGSGSIADMMPAEKRGRALSLWSMGPLTGPIVGPVCAGFLVEAKGWRWVFWIITIVVSLRALICK